MRRAVVLALLVCGCDGASVLRIAADVFNVACTLRGRAPVAFDVFPDGGVRAVYERR